MSSYPGIIPGWIPFGLDAPHPEPLAFVAGDSLKWSRDFPDYPAGAWSLTYVLNSTTQRYLVASGDVTPSGNGFDIAIPSSESRAWAAGNYLWLAILQNAATGERVTGAAGRVAIQPDLLDATTPVDTRSWEETALENVQNVLKGRAADGVLEYKIGDRELRRYSMDELLRLEATLQVKVRKLRILRGEYVQPETIAFHAGGGILG